MAVVMIDELAGGGPETVDLLRQLGLLHRIKSAPGFIGHWSGTTSTGYRVVEIWDSPESHQAWYESAVRPSLPPGAEPPTPTYVDVLAEVQPG